MPYVKLSITIPDLVWMSDLSQAFPETVFRVTAATVNDDVGVAHIDVHGEDSTAIVESFRDYDAVTDLTVLDDGPEATRVQLETTSPLMLRSIQDSGVPLQLPFEVQDGELLLELTVPSDTMTDLTETLGDYGIPYTVERVSQDADSGSLLTDRQEWVLDRAVERGYYDTPRETTLAELADDLDMAKSTCSELLHRAEGHVIKDYHTDTETAETEAPALSE